MGDHYHSIANSAKGEAPRRAQGGTGEARLPAESEVCRDTAGEEWWTGRRWGLTAFVDRASDSFFLGHA